MANRSKVFATFTALVLALALSSSHASADEPVHDDFDGGAFSGGTGWSDSWQTEGSVDTVDEGSAQVASWHMRLRSNDGVAFRDVDVSGLTELDITVWARTKSFENSDFAILLVGPPGELTEVHRWVSGSGDDDDNDDDDDHDDDDHDHHGSRHRHDDGEFHPLAIDLENFDTSGVFRIQFESHMNSENDFFYVNSVIFSDGLAAAEEPIVPTPSTSNEVLVMNGEFDDWSGKANIADPTGDADKDRGDIVSFYWGDNSDDDTVYWMIERVANQKKLARYSLHLDMNNDGDFKDSVDRIVEVKYRPRKHNSKVDVKVRGANSHKKIAEYKRNDWGDSEEEGGARVEFGVPSDDLGFSFGSAFRMYVESNWDDRAPDSGDIQWSPMPILGIVGMAVLLLGGGTGIWWFKLRGFEGRQVPQV